MRTRCSASYSMLSFFVPAYLIMAAVIGVIGLGYLALNPDKAFMLTIFTIPFVDRIRVLPISFSLNELVLLFTFLVCLGHMVLRSHRVSLKTSLDGWILLLTVTFFLAGFFSESDTGMLGFFKVFEAFIMYYMTVYLIRTRQITRSLALKVVLFTALSQAALGSFQSFTGIGSDFQSARGYLGYLGLGSNIVWHDHVYLSEDTCACGSAFRKVDRILGRSGNFLITPEGCRISITAHIPCGIDNLIETQFCQKQAGEVTIKILTNGLFTDKDREQLIRNTLTYTSPRMKVDVKEVTSIPRGPNGKFISVINEIGMEN